MKDHFFELVDHVGATYLVNPRYIHTVCIIDWGRDEPHRARVNVLWCDGDVDRNMIIPGVDKPTAATAHESARNLIARLAGREP